MTDSSSSFHGSDFTFLVTYIIWTILAAFLIFENTNRKGGMKNTVAVVHFKVLIQKLIQTNSHFLRLLSQQKLQMKKKFPPN
jgi:hypothetical protein